MTPAPVRLPHSGLTVPHTGYAVTSYREHPTPDGVAFTATLRLNNTIVGSIENDGHGGPDMLLPHTATGYRATMAGLEEFAASCTDARGETPSVEYLLGDLVTEYQTGRDIRRAAKRGHHLLRLMQDYEGDDGPMGWADEAAITEVPPALAADPQRLRAHLLGDPRLAPDALSWWQIWDAGTGRWNDTTPRPAHLPDDPAGDIPAINP